MQTKQWKAFFFKVPEEEKTRAKDIFFTGEISCANIDCVNNTKTLGVRPPIGVTTVRATLPHADQIIVSIIRSYSLSTLLLLYYK